METHILNPHFFQQVGNGPLVLTCGADAFFSLPATSIGLLEGRDRRREVFGKAID